MTLEELDDWLDRYGRAWERRDVDAFVALFDEEATYHWGPFSEPLRGHAQIRTRTQEAISQQEDVRFGHELLATTEDGRGICRWWVSLRLPAEAVFEENEGIFLITLGADGRCVEFREWWNERARPVAAGDA